jgi:hypothetical protein
MKLAPRQPSPVASSEPPICLPHLISRRLSSGRWALPGRTWHRRRGLLSSRGLREKPSLRPLVGVNRDRSSRKWWKSYASSRHIDHCWVKTCKGTRRHVATMSRSCRGNAREPLKMLGIFWESLRHSKARKVLIWRAFLDFFTPPPQRSSTCRATASLRRRTRVDDRPTFGNGAPVLVSILCHPCSSAGGVDGSP